MLKQRIIFILAIILQIVSAYIIFTREDFITELISLIIFGAATSCTTFFISFIGVIALFLPKG